MAFDKKAARGALAVYRAACVAVGAAPGGEVQQARKLAEKARRRVARFYGRHAGAVAVRVSSVGLREGLERHRREGAR